MRRRRLCAVPGNGKNAALGCMIACQLTITFWRALEPANHLHDQSTGEKGPDFGQLAPVAGQQDRGSGRGHMCDITPAAAPRSNQIEATLLKEVAGDVNGEF